MAKHGITSQRFATWFRPLSFGVAMLLGLALTITAWASDQITIEERQLSERNLTNYEFNASIRDMQAAIKKAFGYEWIHELSLESNSTVPKGPVESALQYREPRSYGRGKSAHPRGFLMKPGNEEDAYGSLVVYNASGYPRFISRTGSL